MVTVVSVLTVGMAWSWDCVLCVWSDSYIISRLYILHCTGDKGVNPRGNRGEMSIGFGAVLLIQWLNAL